MQVIFVEFPVHLRWVPGPEDGYSVVFSLMTPGGRGFLRLASPDPDQPPLIDLSYLTEPGDLARMIAGLHPAREIGSAAALSVLRDHELYPGEAAESRSASHAYLRHSLSS